MAALKRSGGWPRKSRLQAKTPFTSSSSLSGGSPLAAGRGLKPGQKGLKRSKLVARPPVRTPAEDEARRLVELRAEGRCEGCNRLGPTEWAHRVSRAQGGPWTAANGLALCGDLTGGHAPTAGGGCHPWSHSTKGRPICEKRGWILRRRQDPTTTPVLLAGRGLVLLDAAGGVTPYREAA